MEKEEGYLRKVYPSCIFLLFFQCLKVKYTHWTFRAQIPLRSSREAQTHRPHREEGREAPGVATVPSRVQGATKEPTAPNSNLPKGQMGKRQWRQWGGHLGSKSRPQSPGHFLRGQLNVHRVISIQCQTK